MANEMVFTVKVNGVEKSVASIKDLETELKNLTKQWKEMDKSAPNFEQTKAELDAIKDKLKEVNKSQEQLSKEAEAKAAKIKAAYQNSNNGLAESFGNASAAMGAFGIQGEGVNKAMMLASAGIRGTKSVMTAFTPAADGAKVAAKGFGMALKGLGIGLIIAALSLLIENFDKIKEVVMGVVSKFTWLTDAIDGVRNALSRITGGFIDDAATAKNKKNAESAVADFAKVGGAYDKLATEQKQNMDLMKAQGKSEKEIHDQAMKDFDARIAKQKEHVNNLKTAGKTAEEIAEAEKALSEEINAKKVESAQFITNINNKKKEKELENIEEAKQKEKEALKEREDAWKAYEERVRAEVQKSNDNLLSLEDEYLELKNQAYLDSITDVDLKERESLRLKQENEELKLQASIDYYNNLGVLTEEQVKLVAAKNAELLQMQKNHEQEKTNLVVNQAAERTKKEAETIRENKLAAEQVIMEDEAASFEAKREASLAYDAILLEDLTLTEAQRNKIEADGVAYRMALADKEKQKKIDNIQAWLQISAAATEAAMNLSDAIFQGQLNNVKKGSAEELKIRKKQFATNKALQITMAVITTAQAVLGAYAAAFVPPTVGSPLLGILNMAMAGAIGISQIAKIATTKFDPGTSEGGDGGGGDPPKPAPSKFARGGMVTGPGSSVGDTIPAMLSSGESVMNARSTQMYGGLLSEINQAGGGIPIGNSSQGGPIFKTYVVASDMTNQQEADKKIKDLARI